MHKGYGNVDMTAVLACVLAGGRGKRLEALTARRAKPALHFGGEYRIIDYTLSNCFNSGVRQVAVMTQYESRELIDHVRHCWPSLSPDPHDCTRIWPAEQNSNDDWYQGTADAVRQNLDAIRETGATHVLVLAGDHIYRMDYRNMLESHLRTGADVTVACTETSLAEASRCGVLAVDPAGRIEEFSEKPSRPCGLPGKPDKAAVSMGIYVFQTQSLIDVLAADGGALHDFGGNILPMMIGRQDVRAFQFVDELGQPRFWRDAGTVEAFHEANMALLDPAVRRDLYRDNWPVIGENCFRPPAILESDDEHRNAVVIDSILGRGSRVRGASISRSVLSSGVFVDSGSVVENTVLLPGASVGKGCWVRNAVVDEHCRIPDDAAIDANNWRGDPDQCIQLVTSESLAAASANSNGKTLLRTG